MTDYRNTYVFYDYTMDDFILVYYGRGQTYMRYGDRGYISSGWQCPKNCINLGKL